MESPEESAVYDSPLNFSDFLDDDELDYEEASPASSSFFDVKPPLPSTTTTGTPATTNGATGGKKKRKGTGRTRSCENCRSRKVKCSRGSPCLSCVMRKENCTWRGGVKPTPAPRNNLNSNATSETTEAKAEIDRLNLLVTLLLERVRSLEEERDQRLTSYEEEHPSYAALAGLPTPANSTYESATTGGKGTVDSPTPTHSAPSSSFPSPAPSPPSPTINENTVPHPPASFPQHQPHPDQIYCTPPYPPHPPTTPGGSYYAPFNYPFVYGASFGVDQVGVGVGGGGEEW